MKKQKKIKGLSKSNKDKIAEYGKVYRRANKDKIAEYGKAYYEANKDKKAEWDKAYYEANKDKIKAYYEAKLKHQKEHPEEYLKVLGKVIYTNGVTKEMEKRLPNLINNKIKEMLNE